MEADREKGEIRVNYFPKVVAHRAAAQLCEGRGSKEIYQEVSVTYRLTDVTQQKDPVISPFKVHNCDNEAMTEVPLKDEYSLYDRQKRVVSKMLSIENMTTCFEEVEMAEQEMPGCGLSLIAKARRNRKIRGGVIADAIGSGKTIVSIALILNGLGQARESKKLPRASGATLVVVPPGLIRQWADEIVKFSPVDVKIVKIHDFGSLQKTSVRDLLSADVVICPVDILEQKEYFSNLVKQAGLGNIGELPKLPPYSGQTEQSEARGVWIPATSADPYGGANNANNQRRRNQSAYYTFTYLRAVQKLRENEFAENARSVPLEVSFLS